MRLEEYLPGVYANSEHVHELQNAIDSQLEQLKIDRDDFFAQLNVQTATWGLAWYEEALGLTHIPGDSYEVRRSRIKTKMQGQGTTTVMAVKAMAQNFTTMAVDIVERAPEFMFSIVFTGMLGEPVNTPELRRALAEIIPAHLDFDFVFAYGLPDFEQGVAMVFRFGGTTIYQMEGVEEP